MKFKQCPGCEQIKDVTAFRQRVHLADVNICRVCENRKHTKIEQAKKQVKENKEWAFLYKRVM